MLPTGRACVVRLAGIVTFLLLAACGDDDGTGEATTTPLVPTPTVFESTTRVLTTTASEPTTTVTESTTTEPTATTPSVAATGDPLVGVGEVELIDDGYRFTEGPQWIPGQGVLLFTDYAGPIYQLAADDQVTVFESSSDGANGLALDPDGRLLAAESATRRVTRRERDGTVTPLAERFEGAALNQPNDIAVRSDGTIYFTDPLYADHEPELDFHGVFRIAPDGSLTAERRGALTEQPNGVALSPDETLLYVSNQAADVVWVFDVADDGSLSEAQTFVTTGDGPDGMAVDNAGNVFVATANGIEVFAPDGTRWGEIPVPPGFAANCAFGGDDGRTLYITAGEGLYRVTLAHPGPY
jgi:gluconolactonase